MQRVALVLAAATVTGIGIAATNAAVNAPAAAPAPSHAIARSAAPSPEAQIDGQIARLSDYALSPGHMDHFVSLLNESARHRLRSSSTYSQNFGKPLDAQIKQLDSTWKQKYGHSFSIRTAENDLTPMFASSQIGTVGKDAKLASEVMSMYGQPAVPAKLKSGESANVLRFGSDESVAVIALKAENGLPETRVPLACKSGGWWRIVAPSTLSADQLRANLQKQFSEMNAPGAKWPASQAEAYRMVAHRVLIAVLG